jgi:predicted DsbA family dithiol-disulfide isomerase
MTITVDVISDVICPWCYIGKRRLEAAIRAAPEHAVRVRWHPYQLNPTMPAEGMDRRAYRTRKFGSWERSLELDAQMTAAANGEGLPFALDKITRTPNTFAAHRVLWLADQLGVQDGVMEALFKAYFVDARNIGERAVLLDAAEAGGLNRDRVDAMLHGDEGVDEVKVEEAKGRKQRGVDGVPFFIVNNALSVSGAQPTDVFLSAFRQVAPTAPAQTCSVGGTC